MIACKKITFLVIYLTKYLGVNLTKSALGKLMKTLINEFEMDTNRWKDILHTWSRRINTVKMNILPKQSTDSMQFP